MLDYPALVKAISEAPIIEWIGHDGNPYPFRLFPFGEKSTRIEKELILEISKGLDDIVNSFETPDYLLTITPTGTSWGIMSARHCNIDIVIGRNEGEDEDTIHVKAGGPHGQQLFITNLKEGDRVIIVDDVVATAQNITEVSKALLENGIQVLGVVAIVTKGEAYKEFEKNLNIPVRVLKNLNASGIIV